MLPQASAAGGADDELVLPPGTPLVRLAKAVSSHTHAEGKPNLRLIEELLAGTLCELAGVRDVSSAWRAFLEPDDVIGLKFNRSGQEKLAEPPVVAELIVRSLLDAGWDRRQIVCIEAPRGIDKQFGTTPAKIGFDREATDFGSGADQFSLALHQVTALVNIPFLKTHNIATLTCALKNLSHGLIKHPARYHANGCAPFIADIVAADPIGSRLRLNLVDALHVVYEGGPDPANGSISTVGMLLACADPVATDTVGLSCLNRVRRQRGLCRLCGSADGVAYLAAAHRRGVGIAVLRGIEVAQVPL